MPRPNTGCPQLDNAVSNITANQGYFGLPMETILYHATTIAVAAVFIVLLLGLRSMMQGDSPNLSQKLMRWRVGLQFFAIVIIVAYALIVH